MQASTELLDQIKKNHDQNIHDANSDRKNAWSIPANVLRLGDCLHYLALMSQSPAANSPQAARPAAPAAASSSMARPAPTDEDFMKVRMI